MQARPHPFGAENEIESSRNIATAGPQYVKSPYKRCLDDEIVEREVRNFRIWTLWKRQKKLGFRAVRESVS